MVSLHIFLASTLIDLRRLQENYEVSPNDSVCRHLVWAHYRFFCQFHKIECISQSRLTEFVQAAFPHMTVRHLAVRGESRPHYYGIRVSFENLTSGSGVPIQQAQSENAAAAAILELPAVYDIRTNPMSAEFAENYRQHYGYCLVLLRYRQYDQCLAAMIEYWKTMPQDVHLWMLDPGHAKFVVRSDAVFYDVRCC